MTVHCLPLINTRDDEERTREEQLKSVGEYHVEDQKHAYCEEDSNLIKIDLLISNH